MMNEHLAPAPADGYVHGLSLARREKGSVAAWIESSPAGEYLCWRLVHDQGLGAVVRLPAVAGHPACVSIVDSHLVWTELKGGRGTCYAAELDDELGLVSPQNPISVLSGENCGDFALARSEDGALELLIEVWKEDGPRVLLLRKSGPEWTSRAGLGAPDGFCVRPRLSADGTIGSWDRYAEGVYRVDTVFSDGSGSLSFSTLPAPTDAWESLSAGAVSGANELFISRCRERVVDLRGAISHHSELVVSVLRDGKWVDVAAEDIDHALNPWLDAYWGFRRFPTLIPGKDGVWLCWEEHATPSQLTRGRLCCRYITRDGAQGGPITLIDDKRMFIVERGSKAPSVLVATKTQPEGFVFHLPYELHTVAIPGNLAIRPEGLDTLRNESTTPIDLVLSIPRAEEDGLRLFFGDPHVHSHLSYDLPGEADELYHFARDVAGLDFVAFTENDATRFTEPLTPDDWERSKRLAETFNNPGVFTAFIGWEYTLHANPYYPKSYDSHRSVLFPGGDGRVVSWTDDAAPTTRDMVSAFEDERVLIHHHHCGGFDLTNDEVERNIELCSGWENNMRDAAFVSALHATLAEGFKLGFFGAGDIHERNPGLGGGLAGVWAKENTRKAIFDAFWQRRIFATTGLRAALRFDVCGTFMGGEVDISGSPLLHVTVNGESPIRAIELIRDGDIVHQTRNAGLEAEIEWRDERCPAGDHFYYVQVVFEGHGGPMYSNVSDPFGCQAWSSPVWVRRLT